MAPQARPLDVLMTPYSRPICCWQIGDLLIDPGPEATLDNVLAALDGLEPRAVLLTHIHLDHAASVGRLARMYPNLTVYVHERGAAHMLDPSKLIASATRIYGEAMEFLWGTLEAVPSAQLEILQGGETLDFGEDGRYEVLYTPGHAVHHVSFLTPDGDAFTGDVAGMRVPGYDIVLPPTPPPDINPVDWQASIAALRQRDLQRIFYTHFGSATDVEFHLDQLSERIDRWSDWAREHDRERWIELVRAELTQAGSSEGEINYQLGPGAGEANYGGLRRYWDKLALTR